MRRNIVCASPWRLASIFLGLAVLEWSVDVYGRLVGWFDAYVFCRSEVAVVAVGKIGCTADFEASGGPGFDGGEVVYDEGDLWIFKDVLVLDSPGQYVTSDVEVCPIEVETYGGYVGVSFLTGGCDTSQAL